MQPLRTHSRALKLPIVYAALLLLCCLFVESSPAPSKEVISTVNATTSDNNNYNCPADCQCVLAQNTHTPVLHAKCTSLEGLRLYEAKESSLPIHSLDLSYLNLKRLSHPLEKLPSVTSIDLSHNDLHEFGHLGRRIKKLNLKHNRITSSKLVKLPAHVQVLNLQHNDITYLPLDLTRLSNLMTLELSHNQINCSCETLEVRNWLQERHVFMEHAVTCTYPVEVKGKSWLQVKQSDICEHEKNGRLNDEEDNELMMGDQPVEGSGDQDDEDELGKAFIPIEKASTAKTSVTQLDTVEGSGDLSDVPANLAITTVLPAVESSQEHVTTDAPPLPIEQEEDGDDGSGSGAGILIIPSITRDRMITDDFETPDADDTDDAFDNKPVEEPKPAEQEEHEHKEAADIFGTGMGIFDTDENGVKNTKAQEPVTEEPIVPVVHQNVEAEAVPDVSTEGATNGEPSAILTANVSGEQKDDSNATYFLLGVLGFIVFGLILYVGIKRCKNNSNAAHDAENPRQTELLDMDKKNLGKPLRNGNEHSPLIGDQTKSDLAKPINGTGQKKPYDANDVKDGPAQQQPLLNGSNGTSPNDQVSKEQAAPVTEASAPHEYHPITPRYPTPKSPRASKYAQYPQEGAEHNNNNNNDDSYLPSSPKLGRYSPVYSPETGRVKIKLTETPRPKTPMLVTRSKSNAGDIITTPVTATNGIDNTLTVPGVHAPTATLVNGH
nr:protein windpipe [Bactrocera oleae]XP_014103649.1 protein windpipe [Bactrocera oleae]XP_014103650.1 protein windpipe [Bactrocera oleae]XP_014103651.1 protein windpipe [Bactrocera oleae]XP_036225846.1 protein windpipe [Bactrocera oleae]XP_036225847.1 protein windpipe [Bactrocera oleae]XP_036225848.1 protein windpipe [Bactrocera oleae]XP_036225849.1 protein windpipe [Bactrocera oleae]XP_036225850.1 protein windpipe [Bactrocera oleae]XP_036225851.1 protein windpipe [Bactrocera oleae]XP_03